MKILWGVVILVIIGAAAFFFWNPGAPATEQANEHTETTMPSDASVVTDGSYEVIASESEVTWSGKKPLIDGYVNTGTIDVTGGTIDVSGETASGTFTMDMNTLHVGLTAKKPGSEGALEGHLKGERWFNVATYPTATFKITKVTARPDSSETFMYDVTGDLTLKGQTHPLSFPAEIYQDAEGLVHARASFEFDRTMWGLTASSASFFDDLADNAVDNMVALSFHLEAAKK